MAQREEKILENLSKPITAKDLAKHLNEKKSDVNAILYALQRTGKVMMTDETGSPPRWKITDTPTEAGTHLPLHPGPATAGPQVQQPQVGHPAQPSGQMYHDTQDPSKTAPERVGETQGDEPEYTQSDTSNFIEPRNVPKDPTEKEQLASFARKVVLLLHTCNSTEYWAVVARLDPPTGAGDDNESLADINRPTHYPDVRCTLGMFACYRTAVVKTGQANECIAPLCKALTQQYFPNTQVIIGVGVAYARDKKLNFADVIISKEIESCVQVKFQNGKITNRGARPSVRENVKRVFCSPAFGAWRFNCTKSKSRISSPQLGCIVSAPWLMKDPELKEELFKHTPDAKGGEMEGWALLEIQKVFESVAVIIIKGVVDYGDNEKEDKWQLTAAKAAVDFTHYRLLKTGGTDFKAQEIAKEEADKKKAKEEEMAMTESKRKEEREKRLKLAEDSLKRLDTIETHIKNLKELFETQKHDIVRDTESQPSSSSDAIPE